jgi:hypothetical protein
MAIQVSIGAPRDASLQSCRMRNQNFQGPLPLHPCGCGPVLPPIPLGSTPSSGRDHSQPTSTVNPQPLDLHLGVFPWALGYNKTPLALVGCRVLIHAKHVTRQSWDFRAKDGFYIGLALNLYCCFKLVKSNTKSQVISDTVEFVMPTAPYLLPCLTTKSSMAFKLCPVPSLMHRPLHLFPRSRPLPIYVIYLSHGILLVRLHQARAASCPPDVQGCPSRSLQGWPHPLTPR